MIISVLIFFTFVNIFLYIRSEWVYNQRLKVLRYWSSIDSNIWWDLGRPTLDTFLPSYEKMLWKFWIWDLNKFLLRPMNLEEEYRQSQQAIKFDA